MTLSRILIANRGEIALRIVRTARDLGATSILPYTPEDLMSPAAELADEAYALPEGSSYTDAAALLEMAHATGADAIHPGYGFLSEDADFARSVINAGITWVGPSPEAMDALGDKMSARATAERAQVAPVPGITDSVTDAETVYDLGLDKLPVCIAKTQKSLSDNPDLLGRPKDFVVTVRDIEIAAGAEFIIPITGQIMRMPGLPPTPSAEKIDIDNDGNITGLF